jgi:hypothetical protein
VQSAVGKLGAANRRHAATMLAAPVATEPDHAEPGPYIVFTQPVLRASIEADLRGRGWRVTAGFGLEGMDFDVHDARVLCAGVVADAEERQAALIAAVRGAGLLILLSEPAIVGDDEFVADLERLAISAGAPGVDWRHDGLTPTGLTQEMVALLRALGEGVTVAEAARSLHLSLRGAHRRLAAARTLLDVSTNQEAILAAVSQLDS